MKSCGLLGICLAFALPSAARAQATNVADLVTPAANATIDLRQVQRVDAAETASDGVLQQRYAFQPAAQPQLIVAPAAGSWNWSEQGAVRLRVQNAMAWTLTLTVDIDGADAQQTLHATVALPPGPPQSLLVPLQATSPRAFGMQAGPPMPIDENGRRVLLATTVQGSLDLHRVHAVRIGIPAPQATQTLWLGQLDTVSGTAALRGAYTAIVDGYGQSTRGTWPEKIAGDAALRQAHSAEAAALARALVARKERVAPAPELERTGWFHTQKSAGRWQLVAPDGRAFFSLGVNAVTASDTRTYVQGREFMFVGLPPPQAPWTAFYGYGDSRRADRGASAGIGFDHGRWFDFYAANVYRVDGDRAPAAWRQRALDRLQAWGFNTIGNWSDATLEQAHRMAYTASINIDGDFGNVSSGYDYWGRMPDPFDPRFAQAVERAVNNATRSARDDPWLLGYFADNELAWAGQGPQGHWGLAVGTLQGAARSAAKQAFIAALRKKYVEPARLATAWGISLANWAALDASGFNAPIPNEAHPAIIDDYSAWLRQYADRYFSLVAASIHRHDPHHLFLDGRFAVNTPEAVAACAAYCDVLSFNVYADVPQHGVDMDALHRLDKPVLITEFHFGSDDRGPFGKGVVSVWNEAQRGAAYARFVQAAASDPAIVGVHWFDYVDQPVSGRLLDGENSHIGLVGSTDIPFAGFVQAVTQANNALSH